MHHGVVPIDTNLLDFFISGNVLGGHYVWFSPRTAIYIMASTISSYDVLTDCSYTSGVYRTDISEKTLSAIHESECRMTLRIDAYTQTYFGRDLEVQASYMAKPHVTLKWC